MERNTHHNNNNNNNNSDNNFSFFKEQSATEHDHDELLKLSLSVGSKPPPPPPPHDHYPAHPQFSPLSIPYQNPLMQQQQHQQQPQPQPPPPPPPPLQFLSIPAHSLPPTPPPPPPPPPRPPHPYMPPPPHSNAVPPPSSQEGGIVGGGGPSSRPTRTRRSQTQNLRQGKSETIPAPYPWATTRRATVQRMEQLVAGGMTRITGQVQCKRCDRSYEMEYDLQQKFGEVAAFITENKCTMHDRAPGVWMDPTLPDCKFCNQGNCVKPILTKKRSINWLFLLLGQLLGCCKLSQLKYFCKHTRNHRTGAKDRVLYLTYLALCKQLDPRGPFDV
ncbi:hypothetical protein Tsubulata_012850 [Turnera subulata]|uniref:DUF7086 domain-containing protein n=1 Tax=Turnera subulata TaxID=218843 RepID=A0A9Q0GIZ8_9ROSI|nr:hypothetical protein Tsubulata_012850 [Turnera subulata]